ncbi:MAG: putative lipid-binding transport protein (Tim44 family) [Lentimonas sp.]|jgi:predicted lipid-binding transport protein (Tim44 family)
MDILFFAVVAVFIFFKLFEQFGKVDEDQKNQSKKRNSQKYGAVKNFIKEKTKYSYSQEAQEPAAKVQPIKTPIDEKSQKIVEDLDIKLQSELNSILQKINLSPSQFIEGAKSAFEIVISSFSLGKIDDLKPLTSQKTLENFNKEIERRKIEQQTLNSKIISIDNCKITDVKTVKTVAHITILFESKQINYITNDKGGVVSGSKNQITQMNDSWTFKKDLQSANLNWQLSSIS